MSTIHIPFDINISIYEVMHASTFDIIRLGPEFGEYFEASEGTVDYDDGTCIGIIKLPIYEECLSPIQLEPNNILLLLYMISMNSTHTTSVFNIYDNTIECEHDPYLYCGCRIIGINYGFYRRCWELAVEFGISDKEFGYTLRKIFDPPTDEDEIKRIRIALMTANSVKTAN